MEKKNIDWGALSFAYMPTDYRYVATFKDGKWIRVTGEVELDERLEAQKHMLEAYPELGRMYQPGDGNTAIFRFKSGRAAICSFTERPVLIEF